LSTQKYAGWRWASVNDAGRTVGEHHHRAKLADEDIELIRTLREQGLSYREIAAKFDDTLVVSKSMVHAVCTYRYRAHTTKGHRRVPLPRSRPADPDEFDPARPVIPPKADDI
jgi:hypothetical protein